MGHQSYLLLAKDEEDKQRILSVIANHNSYNDNFAGFLAGNEEEKKIALDILTTSPMITGEEITHIASTTLLKNKPKKYADYNIAILCCNGGGRHSTFKWFCNNKVECEEWRNQKWLSKKVSRIIVEKLEVVRCVRCAVKMLSNEGKRDYSIGEGAYVCDKCLDEEEEYCFQQHLLSCEEQ